MYTPLTLIKIRITDILEKSRTNNQVKLFILESFLAALHQILYQLAYFNSCPPKKTFLDQNNDTLRWLVIVAAFIEPHQKRACYLSTGLLVHDLAYATLEQRWIAWLGIISFISGSICSPIEKTHPKQKRVTFGPTPDKDNLDNEDLYIKPFSALPILRYRKPFFASPIFLYIIALLDAPIVAIIGITVHFANAITQLPKEKNRLKSHPLSPS